MKIKEGDVAWIGLLAYVVAYDVYAMATGHETLTSSYYRALSDPRRRWVTITAWGYLTGHLYGVIPKRFDLMARVGTVASRLRR